MFKLLAWKMKGWQCDVLDYYESVLPFADHPWFEAQQAYRQANAKLASVHPMVAQLVPRSKRFFPPAIVGWWKFVHYESSTRWRNSNN